MLVHLKTNATCVVCRSWSSSDAFLLWCEPRLSPKVHPSTFPSHLSQLSQLWWTGLLNITNQKLKNLRRRFSPLKRRWEFFSVKVGWSTAPGPMYLHIVFVYLCICIFSGKEGWLKAQGPMYLNIVFMCLCISVVVYLGICVIVYVCIFT